MSKLDANGRWDTKMMTPEFKERYQQRHDQRPNGPATESELELIGDAIAFPYMLTVSERALAGAEEMKNTFAPFMARLTKLIIKRIGEEHQRIRKQLFAHNIRLYQDEAQDGVFYYRYRRRDFEDRYTITREQLRAHIKKRLNKYAVCVFEELEQAAAARRSEYDPLKTWKDITPDNKKPRI